MQIGLKNAIWMACQPIKITVVYIVTTGEKQIKTSSAGNFNLTIVGLNVRLRTVAPDLLVGLESCLRRWTPSPPRPVECRPSPSPAGLLPPVPELRHEGQRAAAVPIYGIMAERSLAQVPSGKVQVASTAASGDVVPGAPLPSSSADRKQ